MLFLFNGTAESKNPTKMRIVSEKTESGKITTMLLIKDKYSNEHKIDLFNCEQEELVSVIESKCNMSKDCEKPVTRKFLCLQNSKILFNYKTKEAKAFPSAEKVAGQDKFYGRSIIVLVNPGRVCVGVDKRNFGPIAHQFNKDANVTISVMMPKWSRWWKIKHPVYIETTKFDERISLLSLGHMEKDGLLSNILVCEDINKEIPKIDVPVKKSEGVASEKQAFEGKRSYNGASTGYQPKYAKGDSSKGAGYDKSKKPYKPGYRKDR